MNISTGSEEIKKTASIIVAGGLDPSGGAGLAADILAVHAAGVIALPVATALTVQDSSTVYTSYPVDASIVEEQLAALMNDFRPEYLKMGQAGSADIAAMVAEFIGGYGLKLVLDPVMTSSSGRPLIDNITKKALAEVLLPKAFLVTPNAIEAEILTGIRVGGEADAKEAAGRLVEMGSANALVKGGHIIGESEDCSVDYLYNGDEFVRLEAARVGRGETRGTGCHLAAAITAYMAKDFELAKAVAEAKRYVTDVIKLAGQGGQGAGQAL